jgi:hypothetical protein
MSSAVVKTTVCLSVVGLRNKWQGPPRYEQHCLAISTADYAFNCTNKFNYIERGLTYRAPAITLPVTEAN